MRVKPSAQPSPLAIPAFQRRPFGLDTTHPTTLTSSASNSSTSTPLLSDCAIASLAPSWLRDQTLRLPLSQNPRWIPLQFPYTTRPIQQQSQAKEALPSSSGLANTFPSLSSVPLSSNDQVINAETVAETANRSQARASRENTGTEIIHAGEGETKAVKGDAMRVDKDKGHGDEEEEEDNVVRRRSSLVSPKSSDATTPRRGKEPKPTRKRKGLKSTPEPNPVSESEEMSLVDKSDGPSKESAETAVAKDTTGASERDVVRDNADANSLPPASQEQSVSSDGVALNPVVTGHNPTASTITDVAAASEGVSSTDVFNSSTSENRGDEKMDIAHTDGPISDAIKDVSVVQTSTKSNSDEKMILDNTEAELKRKPEQPDSAAETSSVVKDELSSAHVQDEKLKTDTEAKSDVNTAPSPSISSSSRPSQVHQRKKYQSAKESKGEEYNFKYNAVAFYDIVSKVKRPAEEPNEQTTIDDFEAFIIHIMQTVRRPVTLNFIHDKLSHVWHLIRSHDDGSYSSISKKRVLAKLRRCYNTFRVDPKDPNQWLLRSTAISQEEKKLLEEQYLLAKECDLEECDDSDDSSESPEASETSENSPDDDESFSASSSSSSSKSLDGTEESNDSDKQDHASGTGSDSLSASESEEEANGANESEGLSISESEDEDKQAMKDDEDEDEDEDEEDDIEKEPKKELKKEDDSDSSQSSSSNKMKSEESHASMDQKEMKKSLQLRTIDPLDIITDLQALVAKTLIESNGSSADKVLVEQASKNIKFLRKRNGDPYTNDVKKALSATLNTNTAIPFFVRGGDDESIWTITLRGRNAYALRIQKELLKEKEDRPPFLFSNDLSDLQYFIKSILETSTEPMKLSKIIEAVTSSWSDIRASVAKEYQSDKEKAVKNALQTHRLFVQVPRSGENSWRVEYKESKEEGEVSKSFVSPKDATQANESDMEQKTPPKRRFTDLQELIGRIIAQNSGSVETDKLLTQVQQEYWGMKHRGRPAQSTDIRKAVLASLTGSPRTLFQKDTKNDKHWTFSNKQIEEFFVGKLSTETPPKKSKSEHNTPQSASGHYDGELEIEEEPDKEEGEVGSVAVGNPRGRPANKRIYLKGRKST